MVAIAGRDQKKRKNLIESVKLKGYKLENGIHY